MSKTQKKTTGNAGKGTVVDAPRGPTTYWMYPEDLIIIGIDTPHKTRVGPEGHHLFDERVFKPRKPHKVAYAKRYAAEIPPICAEKDGDQAVVCYGRQRALDLRAANKEQESEGLERLQLRVTFERGSKDKLGRIMIAENSLGEDDDPIVEARKIQDFFGCYGEQPKQVEEMCLAHGCTETTVREKLKLLELDEKVQSAIQRGTIGVTAALLLHGLSRDEQRAKIEALLANPALLTRDGKIKSSAVRVVTGRFKVSKPKQRLLVSIATSERRPATGERTSISQEVRAAILWTQGQLSEHEAVKAIPGLRETLAEIAISKAAPARCSSCARTEKQLKKLGGGSLRKRDGDDELICGACAETAAVKKW